MNARSGVLAAAVLLAVQMHNAANAGESATTTLAGTPCHVEGIVDLARCYRVNAPENPAVADSRQIALNVAVLPALGMPRHEDPVFLLAGGPGQAATDYGSLVARMFEEVRKRRDVVLVDQRGSGDSQALECALDTAAVGNFETMIDALLVCRSRWSQDLSQYGTSEAAVDLDAVRRALGYAQVNLWGGSYGTRLAQEYQRRYASHVRAVVLDGAVPADVAIPQNVGRDTDRAWSRLVADCRGDAACSALHGDLDELLRRLLARLDAEPATVDGPHPRTGRLERSVVDAVRVREIVRVALYATAHSAWLPQALHRADAGDFAPLLSLRSLGMAWSVDTMTIGLTVNILCSEDVPHLDPADLEVQRQDALFGSEYADDWRRACARWPKNVEQATSVVDRSAVPTLILSGELDPVTPPASGARVAEFLTRARHLIAANTGHNVSASGCAPRLISAFLDAGDGAGLDGACLARIRRPAFAPLSAPIAGATP